LGIRTPHRGKCSLTESEKMGSMETNAKATGAVGMGTSAIAVAIRKEV